MITKIVDKGQNTTQNDWKFAIWKEKKTAQQGHACKNHLTRPYARKRKIGWIKTNALLYSINNETISKRNFNQIHKNALFYVYTLL